MFYLSSSVWLQNNISWHSICHFVFAGKKLHEHVRQWTWTWKKISLVHSTSFTTVKRVLQVCDSPSSPVHPWSLHECPWTLVQTSRGKLTSVHAHPELPKISFPTVSPAREALQCALVAVRNPFGFFLVLA